MIKTPLLIALSIGVISILASCTWEKRLYRPGYNVYRAGQTKYTPPTSPSGNTPGGLFQTGNSRQSFEGIVPKGQATSVDPSSSSFLAVSSTKIYGLGDGPVTSRQLASGNHPDFPDSIKEKLSTQRPPNGRKLALQQLREEGITPTHPKAQAGFILGLLGWLIPLVIPSILAIIFCAIALRQMRKEPLRWNGKGLAIVGLVLGILGLLGVVFFILLISSVDWAWF
ncbi:MAG: hypothetical protein RLZZ630_651, partial [Bacteroidota bacterium]|jgi:hypothetical protein